MNREIKTTKAKKHLGQNFLINPDIIDKIITGSLIKESDTVVEIGPGTGNLTRAIHQKTKHYLGIEADKSLTKTLQNFNIVYEDILQFDYKNLPDNYKVVANIPYYITSPIINYFLKNNLNNRPKTLTLMVQKEVADKILDTKKLSILAIQVQAFGKVSRICNVPKTDFDPVPKVDSSVIYIEVYEEPKITNKPEKFFKCMNILFAQKRKTIKNNLKPFQKTLNLEDEKLQAFLSRRAESLSLSELDQLCYTLNI